MQLRQAPKCGRADGAKVAVVAQFQLLQFFQAGEGPRLDVANVVGVEPKNGEIVARAEAGRLHHCQLVALEVYPLAPHRDLSGDGKQSLLLAGHSGPGLTVAHTLGRAAVSSRHEVQPHHQEQESPPCIDKKNKQKKQNK